MYVIQVINAHIHREIPLTLVLSSIQKGGLYHCIDEEERKTSRQIFKYTKY